VDSRRLDEIVPLLDPTALPRVIGRAEAGRLGFSRSAVEHRLRTGQWRRVLPRTFLTGDTLGSDDRLRAALVFAGDGALLSGAAALTDLGLRSVGRPADVLVLVPRSTTARSTAWVRIRRTARMPSRAMRPGPARAEAARAVADLALETRRLDDVRALVAETVRRGIVTVEELAFEWRTGPRRHSAHLRQAVDEVGGGAWSAPEARAATLLRRAGLPRFVQNAALVLSSGRRVVPDFLWPELRAILEIDSDLHHALAGDADRTADRHLWLTTDGYSVIHRTPRQILADEERFVAEIRAWLAARAVELGR
jgi:hypothetical protein